MKSDKKKNAMRQKNLLLTLVLLVAAETASYDDSEKSLSQNHAYQFIPEINEEYIRHISSILNAYRSDVMGGRLIIEPHSQYDTRYRTWKRNSDLVNSLLSLPNGMDDAGR